MSAVDFTIDAAARLGVQESALTDQTVTGIQQILLQSVQRFAAYLGANWPVDTGRSLRRWRNFTRGLVWTVQNPVEYASWINTGADAEAAQQWVEREWALVAPQAREMIAQDQRMRTLPQRGRTILGRLLRRDVRRRARERTLFEALTAEFTVSRIQQREQVRRQSRTRQRVR